MPDLETLAQKAKAGAVEVQRLGPLPRAPDEHEDVAREQALLHRPFDQRCQRVVRLAHVHRLPVDEDTDVPHRAEDHDILRNSTARVSTSRPSTTRPLGACATRRLLAVSFALVSTAAAAVVVDGAGVTSTMRNRAARPSRFGPARPRRRLRRSAVFSRAFAAPRAATVLRAATPISLPTSRSHRHNV